VNWNRPNLRSAVHFHADTELGRLTLVRSSNVVDGATGIRQGWQRPGSEQHNRPHEDSVHPDSSVMPPCQ
jgi:hypothetical protein